MNSMNEVKHAVDQMLAGEVPGVVPARYASLVAAGVPLELAEQVGVEDVPLGVAAPAPIDPRINELRAYVIRLCMQLQLLGANCRVVDQALAYLKTIGLDSEGISAENEKKLRAFFAGEIEAPRRETDPPGSSFQVHRTPNWPDPAQLRFTTDRGENDAHNMQNRHAPLNRRRTDNSD